MAESTPKGSTVILHRSFWPAFLPRNEAAPAAIFSQRVVPWHDAVDQAQALHSGKYHIPHTPTEVAWLGCREGREQRVQMLSPLWGWVPSVADLALTRYDFQWRGWTSQFAPSQDIDVVMIWQPQKIYLGKPLRQIAEELLHSWFGDGGIYDAEHLWRLSEESGARSA